MVKAAIIGCGKIADSHAAQILRIRGTEIVGACDREPLMARQLQDRFPIHRHFSDAAELLAQCRPDVVHITTPPTSHFELGKLCLEAGCHVYLEKPFTLDERTTRELISVANRRQLQITAGHDDQFSHVARRMRSIVQSGYLGNGPIHMESYYCYEMQRSGYAKALLNDKRHWVRKLPGRLLHNIISHGIARISEFLRGEDPRVIAYGFPSPFLREIGETELVDELRVLISDADQTTAYFTFSSQMRPALHQFRIYGSKNGLLLDQDQETLVKMSGRRLTSYLEKFVPPISFAKQYMACAGNNMRTFLANDFHMKSGMKCLIESFYRSIAEGAPMPIPHREIILTARIMDAIFHQLDLQRMTSEQAEEKRSPQVLMDCTR